jgi:hypothetical protein
MGSKKTDARLEGRTMSIQRIEDLSSQRGKGNYYQKSPLFDDDFMRELLNYIEIGNYVPVACAAMGITETTYYRWFRQGREVQEAIAGAANEQELHDYLMNDGIVEGFSTLHCRCYKFAQLATKASARSEAAALALIKQQMPQQWTAAMTFLERRFPGRWKRREQIDVGDATEGTGIDETIMLTDPEAVKLLHDALERASKGQLPAPKSEEIVDAEVVDDA